MANLEMRWQPYSYWRYKEHKSSKTNVSRTGIRDSYQPTVANLTLFFGGSVMWGSGVGDHDTIPSQVAYKKNLCPINFGQTGFVSTQELIELMLFIRDGYRPSCVVFYDGFNDMYSAYQQNEPGIPMNEFNRRLEFRSLTGTRSQFAKTIYKRLISGIREPFTSRGGQKVAYRCVDVYLTNMEFVQAICSRRRIRTLFYWHPINRKHSFFSTNGALRSFIASAENYLYELKPDWLIDLSRHFEDLDEPSLFLDWVHLNSRGNSLIASRIASDLTKKGI